MRKGSAPFILRFIFLLFFYIFLLNQTASPVFSQTIPSGCETTDPASGCVPGPLSTYPVLCKNGYVCCKTQDLCNQVDGITSTPTPQSGSECHQCPKGRCLCLCAPDGEIALPGGERVLKCCISVRGLCPPVHICTGSTDEVTNRCLEDLQGKCGEGKIRIALGCIPAGNFNDLVVQILKLVISVSGGIAFLLMIFGGFKVLVSAGNPKGVQSGNEMITSALIGLLFILFSVFLLKLIGVTVFQLPGL